MINGSLNVGHGCRYLAWNCLGVIDGRYIMCPIIDANVSKQVFGHSALVEAHYLEVLFSSHQPESHARECANPMSSEF